MPYISKAAHTQLLNELAVVNAEWIRIQKFLADEDEVLAPIYARWRDAQDN